MLGLSGRVREGLGYKHALAGNPNDVNFRKRVSKWANCSHVEPYKWEDDTNKMNMLILLEPDPERRELYGKKSRLFKIIPNCVFECSTNEEASALIEEYKSNERIKQKEYIAKKKSAAAQPGM